MALIFLLKISNVCDSLISFGTLSHNFWPTNLTVLIPRFVLALGKTRLMLLRRLYGITLVTNTFAMKEGFKFCKTATYDELDFAVCKWLKTAR